jgi:putative membrane protein
MAEMPGNRERLPFSMVSYAAPSAMILSYKLFTGFCIIFDINGISYIQALEDSGCRDHCSVERVHGKRKIRRNTGTYAAERNKGGSLMFLSRFGFGPGPMLFGLLNTLFWVALLAVIIWALVTLFTKRSRQVFTASIPHPAPHLSAMEILRQRYARGEIDDATFQQMRERLEGSVPPE